MVKNGSGQTVSFKWMKSRQTVEFCKVHCTWRRLRLQDLFWWPFFTDIKTKLLTRNTHFPSTQNSLLGSNDLKRRMKLKKNLSLMMVDVDKSKWEYSIIR